VGIHTANKQIARAQLESVEARLWKRDNLKVLRKIRLILIAMARRKSEAIRKEYKMEIYKKLFLVVIASFFVCQPTPFSLVAKSSPQPNDHNYPNNYGYKYH
jgi:lipopolysaccharide export LptBFGC system permease protein LptF